MFLIGVYVPRHAVKLLSRLLSSNGVPQELGLAVNIIVIAQEPLVGFWAGEGVPATVPKEGMFSKLFIYTHFTTRLQGIDYILWIFSVPMGSVCHLL